MSEPLVVNIPHRLGKDEAVRRIRDGLSRAKSEFAMLITLEDERWDGDTLHFACKSLGQRAQGTIAVYDGAVRVEVRPPWLLQRFAQAAQRVIGRKGQLMLEKK